MLKEYNYVCLIPKRIQKISWRDTPSRSYSRRAICGGFGKGQKQQAQTTNKLAETLPEANAVPPVAKKKKPNAAPASGSTAPSPALAALADSAPVAAPLAALADIEEDHDGNPDADDEADVWASAMEVTAELAVVHPSEVHGDDPEPEARAADGYASSSSDEDIGFLW